MMPLYLDIHQHIEGLTQAAVAGAHARDLEVQKKYGVDYRQYWSDEGIGKVVCLVEAPSKNAAIAVHREAHGLVADELIEIREGFMMSLHVIARSESLDEIREFVGDIARAGGFGPKDVYAIQFATDEAASNILEHAYKGVTNSVLEISCGVKDGAMSIIMVDYGETFDPSAIPLPDLKADLSERKIGGYGIFLMRKLMDEVHYEFRSDKSNVLTMIKRRR